MIKEILCACILHLNYPCELPHHPGNSHPVIFNPSELSIFSTTGCPRCTSCNKIKCGIRCRDIYYVIQLIQSQWHVLKIYLCSKKLTSPPAPSKSPTLKILIKTSSGDPQENCWSICVNSPLSEVCLLCWSIRYLVFNPFTICYTQIVLLFISESGFNQKTFRVCQRNANFFANQMKRQIWLTG